MRRAELYRHTDQSGISGTGVVAQGVEFDDGTLVLRWLGATPSTVVWASAEQAIAVHGHGGTTCLVWLD